MRRKTVWLVRYEDLVDLVEDTKMHIPDVINADKKFLEGVSAGLSLGLECAKRRAYEAYEYCIDRDEGEA